MPAEVLDPATMTAAEKAVARKRLWRHYRRLKAQAVDARSYMAAADVLGQIIALGGEQRPIRKRRTP